MPPPKRKATKSRTKSKAKKKTGDFYGQPIKKEQLHKDMGVPKGKKIPLSEINAKLKKLKAKKHKTKEDITEERRLVFAKNAKTKWKKKK